MRLDSLIVLTLGAMLFGCGDKSEPTPITPEVLAKRAECGKSAASLVARYPLPKNTDDDAFSARAFYGKANQCWLVRARTSKYSTNSSERHLIDVQTGLEAMTCFDTLYDRLHSTLIVASECRYINGIDNIESATFASGFMAAPIPLPPAAQKNDSKA